MRAVRLVNPKSITISDGTGTIYFKDTLVENGNRLGRWEGEGNALYMLHPIVDNFNCGVFPNTYHVSPTPSLPRSARGVSDMTWCAGRDDAGLG